VTTISSNTLYVNLSGSNYEIELVGAYAALAYGATITAAEFTNNRILATGNFTLEVPTGTTDGAFVNFWITGDGVIATVSLNAAIKIPSSSSFTSPFNVANGGKARLSLQYDATRAVWELVQFINGY
jgi:hypothetical protein